MTKATVLQKPKTDHKVAPYILRPLAHPQKKQEKKEFHVLLEMTITMLKGHGYTFICPKCACAVEPRMLVHIHAAKEKKASIIKNVG